MSLPYLDDTIAALATPPGRSALALLRVSGRRAFLVLEAVCPELRGAAPPPRVQRLAPIVHPESGERLDRGLIAFFPAPRSYTGEDVVEISTHGGRLTPQLVLDALYAAGARPAEPGEFTRRALLNGKLDLLQAEAVQDLIDGQSPALHRIAVHQLERGLSRRLDELRSAILRTEALIAYEIDFPEEDEPPVPPARIQAAAQEVASRIKSLLATAPQGELLREGALVVLAGLPNSGKSSLFNALLGVERAIVTEIPGTTRDALEATLLVNGYPFRLVDTAGLRESHDRVEAIGIEVARRYLRSAQLVLFCAEAGRELVPEEEVFLAQLGRERTLLLRTKADLHGNWIDRVSRFPELVVSAQAGRGIAELGEELLRRAFGEILEPEGDSLVLTRARHVRALRHAADELGRFLQGFSTELPAELAATHLRSAAASLEEMIGAVTPDDVLGEVFAHFCVGK